MRRRFFILFLFLARQGAMPRAGEDDGSFGRERRLMRERATTQVPPYGRLVAAFAWIMHRCRTDPSRFTHRFIGIHP